MHVSDHIHENEMHAEGAWATLNAKALGLLWYRAKIRTNFILRPHLFPSSLPFNSIAQHTPVDCMLTEMTGSLAAKLEPPRPAAMEESFPNYPMGYSHRRVPF